MQKVYMHKKIMHKEVMYKDILHVKMTIHARRRNTLYKEITHVLCDNIFTKKYI